MRELFDRLLEHDLANLEATCTTCKSKMLASIERTSILPTIRLFSHVYAEGDLTVVTSESRSVQEPR